MTSNHTFRAYSFAMSLLVYSATSASQSAPTTSTDSKANTVFSVPQEGNSDSPRFASNDGKQIKGRHEHIPGWQEVKMIPSLSGERKKLVQELFNKAKADAAPLQDEMRQIRQQIQEQGQANSVGEAAGARTGAGANTASNTGQTTASVGAGLAPTQASSGNESLTNGSARTAGKPTPEQKARMNELKTKVQEMRAKTWDQVRSLLSEENLHDLELMREGKLLPDNLQHQPFGNSAQAEKFSKGRMNSNNGNGTSPRNDEEMAPGNDGKMMQENH